MRIEDVNKFKGEIKSAFQTWGESKIDELFPNSAMGRTFAKNGLNNAMNKFDASLNNGIESLFMFVSKDGVVDTDTMIDGLSQLLKEMKSSDYQLGGFRLSIGSGEIGIEMPKNILLDMLVGVSKLRFTTEDINEFKNILN
jgi:hypothetical protein